ncbi:MAG: V-type ATP synthase subunit E [Mediterraneibacter sp.]
MSGLDKMKARILEEAESSARDILDRAGEEADRILREAGTAADAAAAEIAAGAVRDSLERKRRAGAAADMQRKQAVLAAKQEMIREVLREAYEEILGLEAERYFGLMEKLLKEYVLPEEGEICFNSRDLERMPEGFSGRIRTIAAEAGGSLTLSETPLDTDGGFLLVYGGIEENCTLKAVFSSRREELSDQVNRMLFG